MLVGDAGHLVDPLLGEGIYYAIRSGQLAAKSVTAMLGNSAIHHLSEYETLVGKEFGSEFRVAGRLGKIIYGLPIDPSLGWPTISRCLSTCAPSIL
jgi:flavin-dependent dehydrogenase